MPFFIWDPRSRKTGERRQSLVQTIDIAPTILDYFGIPLPTSMQGLPLRDAEASDKPVREAGLYGLFGGHVNVTDGRYVYMRAPISPNNRPLFEYTLMPAHMRTSFDPHELQDIRLADPFPFTKGCRTMKIEGRPWVNAHEFGSLLFDLDQDPGQERPIHDAAVETRMLGLLKTLMRATHAPTEQFERLGL